LSNCQHGGDGKKEQVNDRASNPGSAHGDSGLKERMYIRVSQSTPTATCVPWVPVNVKKVEPKMLFVIVTRFSKTKSFELKHLAAEEDQPEGDRHQERGAHVPTRLPRWIAFTASAIISDDMSRMNVEKDVSSMLKTWVGTGFPGGGCSR